MMNRRTFLRAAGWVTAAGAMNLSCRTPPRGGTSSWIKPIKGSWISIWWDDRRHFYWNETCRKYTCAQWEQAVRDVAELGMEYLVLLAIAKDGRAFYDSAFLPKLPLGCADPIAALLKAGDKFGVKFFLSSDWYGQWDHRALTDPALLAKRFGMMEEIARLYATHRSFYGWYWPNEAHLSPYFTPEFIAHVNACSAEARRLTPRAKTLTAPYGTNRAVNDDLFVRQLDQLDVDIIAYQDEVGCLRMSPTESAAAFRRLRLAHHRVPQRALWADVEVFAWEGPPNQQSSPLIPASFERVQAQLEAVTPSVDQILIYQYQGLMNNPMSRAFAGHPDSTKLYADYAVWLRHSHPQLLKSPLRGG